MLGLNGGLIGVRKVPTAESASGLWVPNEQSLAQRAGIWPLTPSTDPDFTSVSLLLHMDGSNGSTTFTDSSSDGIAVTANGNAQISTAQSKFGGASGLFDGSGDYLSTAALASLAPGTGAFTIECWVRWTDRSGAQALFNYVGVWSLNKAAANLIQTENIMTSASALISTTTFVDNQWYHIAVSRGTGAARLYVDGVEESSVSGTNADISTTNVWVGRTLFGNLYLNGYIDDLRLTIGVDRYTANFTPPTAPFPNASPGASDPNFANVSLLLHADGTDGSTSFPDNSPVAHTLTANGNAQVSTTSPKFGTGALLLDGTGDYLSAPSDSSLTFGTGDFTIEAWVRFDSVTTRQYIFSQRETGGFTLYLLADGRLSGLAPGLNAVTQASATMVVDTWHHVAFTRLGTSYNVWVDGVGSATGTFSSLSGASGTSYIGYRGSGTTELLDGRIDDLRITKGVARYTANFTPPAAPFPDA